MSSDSFLNDEINITVAFLLRPYFSSFVFGGVGGEEDDLDKVLFSHSDIFSFFILTDTCVQFDFYFSLHRQCSTVQ